MNQEPHSTPPSPVPTTLAQRMLEEGRISPSLATAAMERNANLGERFEEALLECGLPESALLRHLAEMYATKFISTKTLISIEAPRQALSRLPQRLAEDFQAVPIRFSADETLTVITSEPGNMELLERIRVSAGASRVRALIARPAAVRATIAKLYTGEPNAFDGLRSSAIPASSQPPPLDGEEIASTKPGPSSTTPPVMAAPPGPPPSFSSGSPEPDSGELVEGEDIPDELEPIPSPTQLGGDAPAPRSVRPARPSMPPPPPSVLGTKPALPVSQPPSSRSMLGDTKQARTDALGDPSGLTEALIVISERGRGSLKGHSVRVARLAYAVCRELDLSEKQAGQAWAAGLLHDLGKTQPHHLTPLNVWQHRDHESAGRGQYSNPIRVLKGAEVHPSVTTAILHMYERFDGRGFPEGLSGESIPYQSRLLALCDSVMDLTLNPDNTLGRIVSPLEACNHIKAQTPRVFDPVLVAHFTRLLVESRLDEVFLNERSAQGIEKLLT